MYDKGKNFSKYSERTKTKNFVTIDNKDKEEMILDFLSGRYTTLGSHINRSQYFMRQLNKVIRDKNSRDLEGVEIDLSKTSINIVTWADVDMRTGHCWGDYWVKKRFEYHLKELGFQVGVPFEKADISIYLWGSPIPYRTSNPRLYNPASYNICWAYSHPQRMTREEIAKYDRVYALSEFGVDAFSKLDSNRVVKEPLIGCSDFEVPEIDGYERDVGFVGNARGNLEYGREVIHDLELDKNIKMHLYGAKWNNKKHYPKEWFKGFFIDYYDLPMFYKTTKIGLNDHREDMAPYRYVSVRVFDILRSGGLCLSDYNPGIEDIFGDAIPMYRNKEELNKKIRELLNDEDLRKDYIERGKTIASQHHYIDRIKTILGNEGISCDK